MYSKAFFPVECLVDIFRHLEGRDLINCTGVAPNWNDFIGSNSWCMQKIKIKIYSWKDYIQDVEVIYRVLTNSNRKYGHLLLLGNFGESMRLFLAAAKRQWTQVSSGLEFETVDHCLEFFEILEPFVQRLDLWHGIKNKNYRSCFERSDLKFTNLKSLTIMDDFVSFYDKTFASCMNLESVSFRMWYDQPKYTLNAIRKSLKCNTKLKSLDLFGGLIFSEDFLTGISFKLTSLSITQVEKQFQQIFNSFLTTQKDSLETLTIGRWINVDVMNTILSMPRLHTAALSPNGSERKGPPVWLPAEIESIQSFPQNFSVTSFHLNNSWITSLTPRLNKLFLKAFPNIDSLRITTLDDENAAVIAETCKSLKKLEVDYFNAKTSANETFYLNLDKIFSEKVHEDSQQLFKKLNGEIFDVFNNSKKI